MHEDQALQWMWKGNTACTEFFSPEVLFIYFLHLQGALTTAENQSLLCKNEIAIFAAHSSFGQDMKNITSDWKYNSCRGGQDIITQIVVWPGQQKYPIWNAMRLSIPFSVQRVYLTGLPEMAPPPARIILHPRTSVINSIAQQHFLFCLIASFSQAV